MRFKQYIRRFTWALNPAKHKELVHYRKRDTIAYFLDTFLFGVVLMILSSIPAVIMHDTTPLQEFESIGITITPRATHDVKLLENPDIVYTPGNGTPSSIIGFNDQSVFVKKYGILGASRAIFEWNMLTDAKAESARLPFTILLFALVPGLMLIFAVMMLVKYFLLGIFAWMIGLLLYKIIRFRIRFMDMGKQVIYSMTPMIVLDFALAPWIRNWWPTAIFAFLFVVSIVLIGEHKPSEHKEE